ncbi:MAG: hypothetical protein ACE5E5_08870 [Phycisphaerae bacterium]
MTLSDTMWERSQAFLTITRPDGRADLYLWEHTARIARAAVRIAAIPEVSRFNPDTCAVEAAALFHNAAWVQRVEEDALPLGEVLVRPIQEGHYEVAATALQAHLSDLIPQESLRTAAKAVRSMGDRGRDVLEGKIVSDAGSLDEFGIASFCRTVRVGLLDGFAIQAVIDRWHRRTEYDFWTARLNESFHFKVVRELAKSRLGALERLMADLEREQLAADVEAVPEHT